MSKIISIANQKGGVGKTTTAINLASALSKAGLHTLLIDFDPQTNATRGLGVKVDDVQHTIYDIIENDLDINDAIHSITPNLDIISGDINLAALDIELSKTNSPHTALKDKIENINTNDIESIDRSKKIEILKEKLQSLKNLKLTKKDVSTKVYKSDSGTSSNNSDSNPFAQNQNTYDYIIIDCPPSLGLTTLNAMSASDSVLIPVQCEYYALEGLSQILDTIHMVTMEINKDLYIEGILFTMFDARNRLSNEVVETVKRLGIKTFETIIPRNVRLAEAPSYGESIFDYDKSSVGAKAYQNLASEIIEQSIKEV